MAAPIITVPGYETDIQQAWKDKINLERLVHIADPKTEGQATDFEALIYLSHASLAAPMSTQWYHVYRYLFSLYWKEAYGTIFNEDPALDEQEKLELKKLKEWIYKKQVEHLKSKERQTEKAIVGVRQ